MKSLGQVCYEAWATGVGSTEPWCEDRSAWWEASARAVVEAAKAEEREKAHAVVNVLDHAYVVGIATDASKPVHDASGRVVGHSVTWRPAEKCPLCRKTMASNSMTAWCDDCQGRWRELTGREDAAADYHKDKLAHASRVAAKKEKVLRVVSEHVVDDVAGIPDLNVASFMYGNTNTVCSKCSCTLSGMYVSMIGGRQLCPTCAGLNPPTAAPPTFVPVPLAGFELTPPKAERCDCRLCQAAARPAPAPAPTQRSLDAKPAVTYCSRVGCGQPSKSAETDALGRCWECNEARR